MLFPVAWGREEEQRALVAGRSNRWRLGLRPSMSFQGHPEELQWVSGPSDGWLPDSHCIRKATTPPSAGEPETRRCSWPYTELKAELSCSGATGSSHRVSEDIMQCSDSPVFGPRVSWSGLGTQKGTPKATHLQIPFSCQSNPQSFPTCIIST